MKKHRRIPIPFSQRKDQFRRVLAPLLVWMVAAAIVAVQLYQKVDTYEYVGLAKSEEYVISAEFQGRIESVPIKLYDEIGEGDVVTLMNDDQVLARIATSTARIDKLSADLDSIYSQYVADGSSGRAGWIADLRRFQVDEESRRLAILDLKVDIESDRVELERRNLQLERFRRMMEADLISQLEYDTVRLQTEQMEKRIEENLLLLVQTEEEFVRAEQRRLAYEQKAPDSIDERPLLESLKRAISVESRLLEEIQIERQSLVLRSPISGRIARIDCRSGQSVRPGQSILAVSEIEVREIVAYVPEAQVFDIKEQKLVSLSSRKSGISIVESEILRIGPGIELLPQRLWRDPVMPDYGYGVIIATVPSLDLIPGELVDVKFLDD